DGRVDDHGLRLTRRGLQVRERERDNERDHPMMRKPTSEDASPPSPAALISTTYSPFGNAATGRSICCSPALGAATTGSSFIDCPARFNRCTLSLGVVSPGP